MTSIDFLNDKLLSAAESGNAREVKKLLKMGADVDTADEQVGYTALHLATYYGHQEVIRALLPNTINNEGTGDKGHSTQQQDYVKRPSSSQRSRARANVDALTADGYTPAMLAAINGHVDILDILMHRGADLFITTQVDPVSHSGFNVLHLAAMSGWTNVANLLLGSGSGSLLALIKTTTNLGYTPIQFAAELGHTDIVELLITADCQLQQKLQREVPHGSEDNSPDDTGGSTTPSTGESKGRSRSRSRSSTLNAANMFGITPLHSAVATGDAEHVRTLLRTRTGGGKRQLATACAAVDLDATDQEGHTAVHMAAAHGSADVTQLLLEHGAPLNLRTLPVPYTDLDQNADMQEDGEEGVKGMAKWKASLWGDAATERHFGWGSSTPLMEAVARGHYDAAAVLLRRGADANIPNDAGETPLLLAARFGLEDLVQLLLDFSADLMLASESGETALLAAAKIGHAHIAGMLIEQQLKQTLGKGSAPSESGPESRSHLSALHSLVGAVDAVGGTPLHYAVESGSEWMVRVLLDTGVVEPHRVEQNWEVEGPSPHMLALRMGNVGIINMLEEYRPMSSASSSASLAAGGAAAAAATSTVNVGSTTVDAREGIESSFDQLGRENGMFTMEDINYDIEGDAHAAFTATPNTPRCAAGGQVGGEVGGEACSETSGAGEFCSESWGNSDFIEIDFVEDAEGGGGAGGQGREGQEGREEAEDCRCWQSTGSPQSPTPLRSSLEKNPDRASKRVSKRVSKRAPASHGKEKRRKNRHKRRYLGKEYSPRHKHKAGRSKRSQPCPQNSCSVGNSDSNCVSGSGLEDSEGKEDCGGASEQGCSKRSDEQCQDQQSRRRFMATPESTEYFFHSGGFVDFEDSLEASAAKDLCATAGIFDSRSDGIAGDVGSEAADWEVFGDVECLGDCEVGADSPSTVGGFRTADVSDAAATSVISGGGGSGAKWKALYQAKLKSLKRQYRQHLEQLQHRIAEQEQYISSAPTTTATGTSTTNPALTGEPEQAEKVRRGGRRGQQQQDEVEEEWVELGRFYRSDATQWKRIAHRYKAIAADCRDLTHSTVGLKQGQEQGVGAMPMGGISSDGGSSTYTGAGAENAFATEGLHGLTVFDRIYLQLASMLLLLLAFSLVVYVRLRVA